MPYELPHPHFRILSLAAGLVLGTWLGPGGVGKAAAADAAEPQIVSTSPAVGAKDVDPALQEITVTFDRDMQAGMSWTGGPPQFPPLDESRKPAWRDKRTCSLPVKLSAGTMYRLGINSTTHKNFKSSSGAPATPAVLYFTTAGATDEVQAQTRAPEIVRLNPENGDQNVDPKTESLSVTFSMPMNAGMSWTGGGESFPKIPAGKKPSWSPDGRTCTLPVALVPGHEYTLGLNSASHKNFQSKTGVPLQPVIYRFRTSAAK